MGLDIYHVKATVQRPLTKNPFDFDCITEDEFEGFNVPFAHFDRYIQQIDVPRILQTCILVREERDLQETIDWFDDKRASHTLFGDYTIFFERDKRALVRSINTFATANGLTSLHRYLDKRSSKWDVLEYYDLERKTGFYTTTEGYQRKGVNARFGERFYHDTLYRFALREDFEYAYDAVDYYWDDDSAGDVHLRKKKSKADFIDTFEAGASYLHVSY